jgi:hypothetical protein
MPGLGAFCIQIELCVIQGRRLGEQGRRTFGNWYESCHFRWFIVPPLVAIYGDNSISPWMFLRSFRMDDPETASVSGPHFSELSSYTPVLTFRHSKYSG